MDRYNRIYRYRGAKEVPAPILNDVPTPDQTTEQDPLLDAYRVLTEETDWPDSDLDATHTHNVLNQSAFDPFGEPRARQ